MVMPSCPDIIPLPRKEGGRVLSTTNEMQSFFQIFLPTPCGHVSGIQVEPSRGTTAQLILRASPGWEQTHIQQALGNLSHEAPVNPCEGGQCICHPRIQPASADTLHH